MTKDRVYYNKTSFQASRTSNHKGKKATGKEQKGMHQFKGVNKSNTLIPRTFSGKISFVLGC